MWRDGFFPGVGLTSGGWDLAPAIDPSDLVIQGEKTGAEMQFGK